MLSTPSPTVAAVVAAEVRTGRWTQQECDLFCDAFRLYGTNWKKISRVMGTRSNVQCRTHAQKLKGFRRAVACFQEQQQQQQLHHHGVPPLGRVAAPPPQTPPRFMPFVAPPPAPQPMALMDAPVAAPAIAPIFLPLPPPWHMPLAAPTLLPLRFIPRV